jgi:hypothetical protein
MTPSLACGRCLRSSYGSRGRWLIGCEDVQHTADERGLRCSSRCGCSRARRGESARGQPRAGAANAEIIRRGGCQRFQLDGVIVRHRTFSFVIERRRVQPKLQPRTAVHIRAPLNGGSVCRRCSGGRCEQFNGMEQRAAKTGEDDDEPMNESSHVKCNQLGLHCDRLK